MKALFNFTSYFLEKNVLAATILNDAFISYCENWSFYSFELNGHLVMLTIGKFSLMPLPLHDIKVNKAN